MAPLTSSCPLLPCGILLAFATGCSGGFTDGDEPPREGDDDAALPGDDDTTPTGTDDGGSGGPLLLTVEAPTEGIFLESSDVHVSGRVEGGTDRVVTLNGEDQHLYQGGEFDDHLAWEEVPYRVADVVATSADGQKARERVAVFHGVDPMDAEGGQALGFRLTDVLFSDVASALRSGLLAMDWSSFFAAMNPIVNDGTVRLDINSLSMGGLAVSLDATSSGKLNAVIDISDLDIGVHIAVDVLGLFEVEDDANLHFETARISTGITPEVRGDGIYMDTSGSSTQLTGMDISLDGFWDWVMGGYVDEFEGEVQDAAYDAVAETLASLGEEPLADVVFPIDLGGISGEARICSLTVDSHGIDGVISLGLGGPATASPVEVPVLPREHTPDGGVAYGFALGMDQKFINRMMDAFLSSSGALAMEQVVEGSEASVLSLLFGTLPGGEELPATDAFRIALDGDEVAMLAEMPTGLTPLAQVWAPNLPLRIEWRDGAGAWNTWIRAAIDARVRLDVSADLVITPGLEMTDLAVLEYGADLSDVSPVEEALLSVFGQVAGSLLGTEVIDLSTLMGGDLLGGTVDPALQPVVDAISASLHFEVTSAEGLDGHHWAVGLFGTL